MTFKGSTIVTGVVLSLLSGTAHASILKFTYKTDWAAKGAAISAFGTINIKQIIGGIYKVTDATGFINGSKITDIGTGLTPDFFADTSGNIIGKNNEAFGVETLSGINYDFRFGNATSSSGELSFGQFVISSVPLPNSAPLFGASLVGLAGLGYVVKRKKATIAV